MVWCQLSRWWKVRRASACPGHRPRQDVRPDWTLPPLTMHTYTHPASLHRFSMLYTDYRKRKLAQNEPSPHASAQCCSADSLEQGTLFLFNHDGTPKTIPLKQLEHVAILSSPSWNISHPAGTSLTQLEHLSPCWNISHTAGAAHFSTVWPATLSLPLYSTLHWCYWFLFFLYGSGSSLNKYLRCIPTLSDILNTFSFSTAKSLKIKPWEKKAPLFYAKRRKFERYK